MSKIKQIHLFMSGIQQSFTDNVQAPLEEQRAELKDLKNHPDVGILAIDKNLGPDWVPVLTHFQVQNSTVFFIFTIF